MESMTHLSSKIIVVIAVFSWLCSACKPRKQNAGLANANVSLTEARPLPKGLVFEVPYHVPVDDLSESAPSEADLRIALGNDRIPAGTKISTIATVAGERILLQTESFGVVPLLSKIGSTVYEWSQVTTAKINPQNDVAFSPTNIFIRHPKNEQPSLDKHAVFFLYRDQERLIFVNMADHIASTTGFVYRSGNDFLNEQKKFSYGFKPIEKGLWQISGAISAGLLCDGAILWQMVQDPLSYISATKEYGVTTAIRWARQGDLMVAKEQIALATIPNEKLSSLRECPGKSSQDMTSVLAKEKYISDVESMTEETHAVPIHSQSVFKTGARVLVDTTTYRVLFSGTETAVVSGDGQAPSSTIEVPVQFLLNEQKTFSEDHGKPYTRVYKWTNDQGLKDVSTTTDFFNVAADLVHRASKERVTLTNEAFKSEQSAVFQLGLAEKKASTVDEPSKLASTFIAASAYQATTMAFRAKGSSVLGIKTEEVADATGQIVRQLPSLTTLSMNVEAGIGQRALAAFYLTAIQGASSSADAIVAGHGTLTDTMWTILKSSAQSGAILGLRSAFAEGTSQWIAAGAGGVIMRWRKMDMEDKIGLDNGSMLQKFGNLSAGALTNIVSTYASFKGASAGSLGAVGSFGVMVSEIISGRGTPSMIVGQMIEGGAGYAASRMGPFSPFVYPFAVVASKQANACLQLQEANMRLAYAGVKLDAARASIYRQRALHDMLLWLVRLNPESFDKLNPVEKSYVIATIDDPYVLLRAYFGVEI